ncbi:MAG: ubiquinol-cytochrome c reductase iron-sulfur subunit [Syntrophales bacterium]|nr:ubiquinol-cytochrome c reductase iron-sulfur subunit [Syntrophales bacterium]
MKRRRFLGISLTVLGSAAVGSFVYPLARFLAPPPRTGKDNNVSINKSDIPSGEAKEIVLNNTPVIIINRQGKGYVAFSKICTHLGCLVEYDRRRQRLACPCHAGAFDLEGNVLSGPPPRPLSVIPIRIKGEIIVIG